MNGLSIEPDGRTKRDPRDMLTGFLRNRRMLKLLDELETRLTFLFRNDEGAVAWAYPVTAEPTPHHAAFSTGERLDAA